jgi:hypothetical protein
VVNWIPEIVCGAVAFFCLWRIIDIGLLEETSDNLIAAAMMIPVNGMRWLIWILVLACDIFIYGGLRWW